MPEDVVKQILKKLQDRSPEQKEADALQLRRAEIVKVHGKAFYLKFAVAVRALARQLEAESKGEITGIDFSTLSNACFLRLSSAMPSRLLFAYYTPGETSIHFNLSTGERGRHFPTSDDRTAHLRADEHDHVYAEFNGTKFTTGKALAEKMMDVLFLTELK